MKTSEINGQKKTALDWLAGRAVCEQQLETIMPEKTVSWKRANQMAKHIKTIKNQAVKRRQIVLWCQMVKLAMAGGK